MVTGASSGIGLAFARALADQGHTLTLVARREERLKSLLAELPGSNHEILIADLASDSGLSSVTNYLAKHRCNLLINNAGASVLEPFYASDIQVQQKLLALNCGATTTLAHSFLQQAQAGDALVNVASIVSYLPTPAQPLYSASKAYLAALSECLWEEQRTRGVYVMALCPGITRTEFIATATGGKSGDDNLPALMVQTADDVVTEALAALAKRRKAIIVTGRANRMMLWLPRLLSRHRLINVLAKLGDPETAL